jgi:photosystem II stability/assembly factor-like uncharacterized protein
VKRDQTSRVARWAVNGLAVAVVCAGLTVSSASGAGSTTTRSIASAWFSSPLTGYGVVTAETTSSNSSSATCADSVGRTSDGGHDFAQFVHVLTWNCASVEFSSRLVFDGHGDGFLYGPRLFATHDGGRRWSQVPTTGPVLEVAAVGRSVWFVENVCAKAPNPASVACRLAVEQSVNGGRSWTADAAFSREVRGNSGTTFTIASTQSVLVRPRRNEAIVISPFELAFPHFARSTALLVTSDGGRTWTKRTLDCGIDAFYATLAVPTGGPWMGVCAGQGSAGFQAKSVVSSDDSGRTWSVLSRCVTPPGASCSATINVGYLGVFVAATPSLLVESGTRSALNVSEDGGRTWSWRDRRLASYGDGASTIQFFGAKFGLAVASSGNLMATTSDSGRHWRTFRANLLL